jgi:hypothetical protein
MSSLRIGSGSTPSGNTPWQAYLGGTTGIFVDVDTSSAGFKKTPTYVTSITGTSNHWSTTGGSSIYSATPTSFRIFIRYADGGAITPPIANGFQWAVNWVGIET